MALDILQPHIVTAASTLLGVTVGGFITRHGQKRERQQQHIRSQLAEFYSPMLALRARILARSEFRLKLSGAADRAWQTLIARARPGGPDQVGRTSEERFPSFEKIITDNNRILADEIVPAYRKMLEIFSSSMHLAEFSTIEHLPALVEFVEIWDRSLDNGLPGEVVKELNHSEEPLHPFYEDLADNFSRLQQALKEQRRWGWRRPPTIKVLPSR